MEFNLAIIQWIDSTYYRADYINNIDDIEQIHSRTLISCGFLVYEDDECVVIAQDQVVSGEAKRLVLSIPKVSIMKLEIFTKKLENF